MEDRGKYGCSRRKGDPFGSSTTVQVRVEEVQLEEKPVAVNRDDLEFPH